MTTLDDLERRVAALETGDTHLYAVTPHTSCRYGIVFRHAFTGLDSDTGYMVVAVHALADDGCILASPVTHPTGVLGFGKPKWVNWHGILYMAANSKAASSILVSLQDEDEALDRRTP